ncbi:Tigger transposable element-derived protein 4-like [Oopsacas minuta]|uniref:Tigger transposable element-derived protein 4-like n=1 Tax=Oopsacas minuta TaxID=111878 RepID=A0AAV7KFK2_9METZ|nr:Tigger transposable element-derived protein 4-like [Oopsacas minuta]
MTTSKSRNDLALQEKVKLLKEFEVGGRVTQKSVAVKFTKAPYSIRSNQKRLDDGIHLREVDKKVDSSLGMNKRNICLLVDNCSAHPKSVALTNICLKFLPANTTSIMQSMDMGVIKNRKAHYKSRLNSRIINAMDGNLSLRALDRDKSITLLDALYLCRMSWDAVEGNTIAKCCQKRGFVPCDFIQSEGYEFNLDDDHMLEDVSLPCNMSLEEFENFITMDSEIPVSGDLSDVELLDITRKKIRVEDSESDGDSDGDGDNLRPFLEQNFQMVDHLIIFIHLNGITNLLPMLQQIDTQVHDEVINSKKQATMDSFFVNI